jgi:DNA-directed RNA polymerase specialized sigma24 family protein
MNSRQYIGLRIKKNAAAKHVKTNEQKKSGRTLMQHVANDPVISLNQRSSGEWAKLIRKLRWVGLEEEARRLELAMSALPPEQRGCVSAGPSSTD